MDTMAPPDPLLELAVGILMLIAVILVHGVRLRLINRRFSRAWSRVTTRTSHWRINLLLISVVGSLAGLHLFETLIFAAPLNAAGLFPHMRDSYYYVLESYTTLGSGRLDLPEAWRLLGPIIAMAGLFTFSWTASALVSIMTRYGSLDGQHAREARDDGRDAAGPRPEG